MYRLKSGNLPIAVVMAHRSGIAKPDEPITERKSKQRKILIVDDAVVLRLLGTRMVERMGHSAITADNGRDCIAKFKDDPDIDVVVLDYMMPQMNGMDALRELMGMNPNAKVIICSGYTENLVPEDFLGAGASAFLAKPYDYDKLKDTIDKLLRE